MHLAVQNVCLISGLSEAAIQMDGRQLAESYLKEGEI